MSVRRALGVYRSFQAKDPDWVSALDERIQFPSKLGLIGRVVKIIYQSGKWREDGLRHVYIHRYESGVKLCEAWREGLAPVRAPEWPRELIELGELVEAEVEDAEGQVRYVRVPKATLLCATPDGKTVVLLHLRLGILAALVGGAQRITDRGIEG